jgi:hypothetical protein
VVTSAKIAAPGQKQFIEIIHLWIKINILTLFIFQIKNGIQLGMGTAEELAAQGITAAEAQQGFGQIGTQQELFNPLQGEQAITQEQQISGTFGTNAEARKAIAARRRSRQAAFETGGGFATTQGASALGTVGQ